MRMDAHYEYPTNYVSRLVQWLAGKRGRQRGRPLANGARHEHRRMARAIAVAVTHPFGIGNAYYRLGVSKPRSVDTVPFGCYRRDVFDRIGKFDEDLLRNQDLEFNLRLRKRGGRILLVPDVVIRGRARDSLRKLIRLYYQYGYFNPLVMWKLQRQGEPAANRVTRVCAQFAGNGHPRAVVSLAGRRCLRPSSDPT